MGGAVNLKLQLTGEPEVFVQPCHAKPMYANIPRMIKKEAMFSISGLPTTPGLHPATWRASDRQCQSTHRKHLCRTSQVKRRALYRPKEFSELHGAYGQWVEQYSTLKDIRGIVLACSTQHNSASGIVPHGWALTPATASRSQVSISLHVCAHDVCDSRWRET
jgi:hypothetical protein